MKCTVISYPYNQTHTLTCEWSDHDLIGLDLSPSDVQCLDEYAASTRMSDKLLALELLARRYEIVRDTEDRGIATMQMNCVGEHAATSLPLSLLNLSSTESASD
jgi:hypothetical protein